MKNTITATYFFHVCISGGSYSNDGSAAKVVDLTKQLSVEKETTSKLREKVKKYAERIGTMEVVVAEAHLIKTEAEKTRNGGNNSIPTARNNSIPTARNYNNKKIEPTPPPRAAVWDVVADDELNLM